MKTHFQTIIVGGGLSGLTVAHKLRHRAPDHKYLLLEKSAQCGGVIATHSEDGYIAEIGPHGFLDNCQESQELLMETGLNEEAVKAPLIDFVRYVFLNNQLNLIPQTPGKIMKATLIPWPAKLRVVRELFQPLLEGEPTVAKWINHRFGPALLPYFDAVFTGTYAGDYDRLTIDAVMPGLRRIEKQHGSVLKGLLAGMWEKRKDARKSGGLTLPAMTSFPTGMQRLADRLAEPLRQGEDLLCNCGVTGVEKTRSGWKLTTESQNFTCTNLVLALPVNRSLKLLSKVCTPPPCPKIPEAWITTVAMGFRNSVTIPPGFGFLTPEVEKRFALGCLFSSNMFPGRSPEGTVLVETLVGGRRHPERCKLKDEELIQKATSDIQSILNIREEPIYTRIIRSDGGIPQLEKGYTTLLQWHKEMEQKNSSIALCGFGWDGIGVNDMIKHSTRVAEKLLTPTVTGDTETEVKGIYF